VPVILTLYLAIWDFGARQAQLNPPHPYTSDLCSVYNGCKTLKKKAKNQFQKACRAISTVFVG
jgi:hypothetical protein